jgi:hypothetical protein
LVLQGLAPDPAADVAFVRDRLGGVAAVAADRRAELVVAGRVSTATLRWLEQGVAARVRALVEERGLRASSILAMAGDSRAQRAPASVLGLLLDRDGPGSLAAHLERLGEAAVVDTRSCWPIGWVRTSGDGPRWRTGSPRTCSSPTASATHGCAS